MSHIFVPVEFQHTGKGYESWFISISAAFEGIWLVYQRKRKAGRFYPTRLALNITNTRNKPTQDIEEDAPKGYVIVETNYRVYAYTDSNLQVALISLFTELIYRQALRGG
nr:unnamed protein product [Callosobruchus chinensis]